VFPLRHGTPSRPAASLASTATDHQASSGASTAGSAPAAELRADLAGQLFCMLSNSYSSYQAPPKHKTNK